MALKPIVRRTIPCLLGTCYKDQWCPHTVKTTLATDGDGTPAVQATSIMVGSDSDGKELLGLPPGTALWWQIGEELAL